MVSIWKLIFQIEILSYSVIYWFIADDVVWFLYCDLFAKDGRWDSLSLVVPMPIANVPPVEKLDRSPLLLLFDAAAFELFPSCFSRLIPVTDFYIPPIHLLKYSIGVNGTCSQAF